MTTALHYRYRPGFYYYYYYYYDYYYYRLIPDGLRETRFRRCRDSLSPSGKPHQTGRAQPFRSVPLARIHRGGPDWTADEGRGLAGSGDSPPYRQQRYLLAVAG